MYAMILNVVELSSNLTYERTSQRNVNILLENTTSWFIYQEKVK